MPGPSGYVYTIRPINLQRHALSGAFPSELRELAIKQALGIATVDGDSDVEAFVNRAGELGAYFDNVITQMMIDPPISEPEQIELIPAVDYDWLVALAMGQRSDDGEGNPIWSAGEQAQPARFQDADPE